MQRRKFIQTTASASTALVLSSLDSIAIQNKPNSYMNANFELKLLATNWGWPGSIEDYCARVKKDGYDGIEIWWQYDQKAQDELFAALKRNQLEVGFLCAGHEPKFADNFSSFKKMVTAAATNKLQKPLYINCHSGKDFFSFDDNRNFIDFTMGLARDAGIKICHETHRSRILFAAPVARHFMAAIPGLRITLDISHWCNVHESLLQDQQDTINVALERVDHIHARVGHPEGPQVNDPRAPEWADALNAHLAWWDKVVEIKKKAGDRLTILTEFGPPHYMPALPYTVQPVSDQWAINVHMMQMLRKRYA